jgi:hypothetical protein
MQLKMNVNAEPFTPSKSSKTVLSPLAKEFMPQYQIEENEFFDKLERKFVAENRFIFDYVDEPEFVLKCKNTEFEQVRGPRFEFKKFKMSLSTIKDIKSWADVVSSV